jgi:hypothetical protein
LRLRKGWRQQKWIYPVVDGTEPYTSYEDIVATRTMDQNINSVIETVK